MVKSEKGEEQYEQTAKSHKSSVTFWAKANLQSKKEQKSAAVPQSMDMTDLEITSLFVYLCLKGFYCQANLKLINSIFH